MGLTRKYLKDCGITPEKLRGLFTAQVPDPKIAELTAQVFNRVYQGRLLNLRDYKFHAACDMAFDAPFRQSTATIIQNSLAGRRYPDVEKLIDEYKSWGMDATLAVNEQQLPNGKKYWAIDPPKFSEVIVPLTTAYLTIRVAKVFNDRNSSPFFRYTPSRFTRKELLKCEIISDLENRRAIDFGYPNVLRQAILQAFHYSAAWMFPCEAWYSEQEPVGDYKKLKLDPESEKEQIANATPTVGAPVPEERKTITKREGLRYHLPHPTRTYYDLNWRPSTINSDSGCQYAGHWSLYNYRDLKGMGFWNLDVLPFGKNDWLSPGLSGQYFREIYPCVGAFPCGDDGMVKDRPGEAMRYSVLTTDAKVFLTDHFQKLVPKDWGLGDCEFPVWFRFVIGNESTVFHVEPLLYTPPVWCGIDTNELAPRSASLTLQILPFQDQISNILSQILFTQKANLSRIAFYDMRVVDKAVIEKVMKSGDAKYAGIQWVPYDGAQVDILGAQMKDLFQQYTFTPQDISPMVSTISTLISIMERLLNMSSQEVGAPASHEQTAEEIRVIGGYTSQRVAYSGSFVDDFIDAWKRQLFEATLAYADDEFVAQVAYTPEREALLKEMGFDATEKGDEHHGAVVTGSLSDLRTDSFAPNREGPNRPNNQALAQVIMQTVTAIASNQMLSQAVGAKPMLDMLQEAAILAGAPRDFTLKTSPGADPAQQQEAMQQQLSQVGQQIQSAIMGAVQEQVKKLEQEVVTALQQEKQQVGSQLAQVADQVAKISEALNQEAQRIQQMEGAVQQIMAPQPPAPPQMPPPEQMMPPQQMMPPEAPPQPEVTNAPIVPV